MCPLVEVDTRLLPCWARRQGLQSDDGVDLGQNIFTVLIQTLPDLPYDLRSDGKFCLSKNSAFRPPT